jgi:hypothetical protein
MEKVLSAKEAKEVIAIKDQIVSQFTNTEWAELGYVMGCHDIINNHSRLLRSLSWQDSDYETCVFEVLYKIIARDPENFRELKKYISEKYSIPQTAEFISTAQTEMPKRLITFSPHVFSVPTKLLNEKLVSVMLPFKEVLTFDAIKKSCSDLNLTCKKADDLWENSIFMQDIFELIFTSKVVVADFTGKNANVFYEVGIAHTLGKTVIPITQSYEDLPSDLQHHRALKYLPNTQGYSDLSVQLTKRLVTLFPKENEY